MLSKDYEGYMEKAHMIGVQTDRSSYTNRRLQEFVTNIIVPKQRHLETLEKLHAEAKANAEKDHQENLTMARQAKMVRSAIQNLEKEERMLTDETTQLQTTRETTKRMLEKIEIIPVYLKYAMKNDIDWDEELNSLGDLIRMCNEHRQRHLLENHHHSRHSTYCDSRCTGWAVGNLRCDCGNFKGFVWDDQGLDYYSVDTFNVNMNRPYGFADQQWF